MTLIICLAAFALLPVHQPTADDIQRFIQLKQSPELLESAGIIPLAAPATRTSAYLLCFLLGIASGFYSVPLLTFIQARPAASEKGRVFAAVNWLNWVFILTAALVYGAGMTALANRANLLLAALGVLTLITGSMLLPGIFRRLRQQRPDFVYFRKP